MPAWRNQNMSMRNPMSRAPMNNNPMGNQAPMQPNFGRAVGAIGATSMPYAGGSLGMAGPATAAQGMSAMQPAPQMRAPAMQPQQPPTGMRPLNIPGMQFDASRNAMVRPQRPQLMFNPSNAGNLSGGTLTRSDDQRWSRMARQAGVRPQDMQAWRTRKIAEGGGLPNPQSPSGGEFVGPVRPNGQPAQMGAQMGPAAPPPAAVAAVQPGAPQWRRELSALAENRGQSVPAGPSVAPPPGSMQALEANYQQWRRPGIYGDNTFGNSMDSLQSSVSDVFNNRFRPWMWRQLGAKGY